MTKTPPSKNKKFKKNKIEFNLVTHAQPWVGGSSFFIIINFIFKFFIFYFFFWGGGRERERERERENVEDALTAYLTSCKFSRSDSKIYNSKDQETCFSMILSF
jgi:hypothetical protein